MGRKRSLVLNMPTVLVVDDDATTRFMMSEFLDTLGYSCVTAVNGKDCLEQLSEHPTLCDMVLMDIHMPQTTGLEASQFIRAMDTHPPASMPIVAVTADTAFGAARKVVAYGMDDVLLKPVDLKSLKNTLVRHIGLPVRPS